MRAVVLERPCAPEELKVLNIPVPEVKPGWVLVKIKAFGINRSEMYTRQGLSPGVRLPRVIGIECVGEVYDPSDSGLAVGQKVVSIMGGLGREFDGSYAEYALIPTRQVYPVNISMDWAHLAAIPETYYTAYGALIESLRIKKGETLLVRGGTSTVGLAAIKLAKAEGLTVAATTRSEAKLETLRESGADYALIDNGTLKEKLKSVAPDGINKVLELAGAGTLRESLTLPGAGGVVCMVGILNGWILDRFEPLADIPSGVCLTVFESSNVDSEKINNMFDYLRRKLITPPEPKIFGLDEIQKAHRLMEDNNANGKMTVVL